MSFLDRLFGPHRPRASSRAPGGWGARTHPEDQALQRYRYLVRTAPPEALEEMFLEAFSRLSLQQRTQAAQALEALLPERERRHGPASSEPRALALRATRAELLQPGTVERAFGALRIDGHPLPGASPQRWRDHAHPDSRRDRAGYGGLMAGGLGGMFAGSLLSSLVGTVIGGVVAHQFLDGFDSHHGFMDEADAHDGALADSDVLGAQEANSWEGSGASDDYGADLGDGGFGDDL